MDQPAPRLARRVALRLVGAASLGLPAAVGGRAAAAGRSWCRADPVLRIGGQTAHVYIASYVEMLAAATDKIRLVVTVPVGVRARLDDILADFGEGYDVRFAETRELRAANGRIPVRIAVYASASDGTLPVVVDFAPVGSGPLTAAGATGTANRWITFRAG
jgi:hypothetical protein